jgi:hypothetical protein
MSIIVGQRRLAPKRHEVYNLQGVSVCQLGVLKCRRVEGGTMYSLSHLPISLPNSPTSYHGEWRGFDVGQEGATSQADVAVKRLLLTRDAVDAVHALCVVGAPGLRDVVLTAVLPSPSNQVPRHADGCSCTSVQ